ncbi:MAG: TfoX/Sxy family protein [Rhodospirillaceae bacterium]
MSIEPVDLSFRDDVTARLAPMGAVAHRDMFGGAGMFLDGLMFALVVGRVLYFKVDDGNRQDFEDAGTEQFSYMRVFRPAKLSYWRVPDAVLDDADALLAWGAEAHAVARRVRSKPPAAL